MGTQKFSSWSALKTHFDKGLLLESVHRIMRCFGNSLWILACSCLVFLLGFITKFVLSSEKEEQSDLGSSKDLEPDGFSKTESFQYFFGLQFQTSEEEEEDHDSRALETGDSVFIGTSRIHSARKFQSFSGKDFSCFLEQPEAVNFTVKELFANTDNSQIASPKDFVDLNPERKSLQLQVDSISDSSSEVSVVKDLREISIQTEAVDLEEAGDSVQSLSGENLSEKAEPEQEQAVPIEEHGYSEIHEMAGREQNLLADIDDSKEVPSPSEDHQFFPFDSKLELTISCEAASTSRASFPVLAEDGNLDLLEKIPDLGWINRDDVEIYDLEALEINENNQEYLEEIQYLDGVGGEYEKVNDSEEETRNREKTEDIDDEEYIELEPNRELSIPSDKETFDGEQGLAQIDHERRERKTKDNFEHCEESSSQKNPFETLDYEDGMEDILMEHRELIEQMKMEAKNARNGGLPTILEECETPRMADDLKPLRFEERLEYKDHVEEIQKVYKSYAEKMRKLDILNYQTVHAISFLQMKDPSHQFPGLKPSASVVKSLLFPSLWPCQLRRIYADPTVKSIAELHRDLETVYVGQACLSWEILHWQYEKAKELLLNDIEGLRSYDQVACELQQFQVLVQRFVENEAFQGPRVQNYAKNRCALRALLQVPAVKDDCLKDKREIREGEFRISVAMLTDIVEESMRVFWEFLRADRAEGNPILKGLHWARVDQSELLTQLKSTLQKKDRRLKDILRSGNCIVKKFQKQKEGRMDCRQLFAQVELKLVGRVLSMSRLTTDQLVWCQKKLNKVKFVNRKIHLEEPSFLLFPF